MLTREQVRCFEERGFVYGGAFLSDEEVEELRSELDRVIREKDTQGAEPVRITNLSTRQDTPVWQVVNIWQASEAFRRLVFRKEIVEDVVRLTGCHELRVWHDQIQFKPPCHGGVNMWHQDGPYWPILRPKDLVTAWIALDDVNEDNGCMSMVPGSHRWENQIDLLHSIEDYHEIPRNLGGFQVEVVRCPVPKGHVHYHHALTWHGSHENRSDRPRRAIAIHYMTEKVRYDSEGTHIMKEFVRVPNGQKLEGNVFPLVWSSKQAVPAP